MYVYEKKSSTKADLVFETEQFIARPREDVFAFFADPANLEAITPSWLHFSIVNLSTPEIAEGTECTYRLRIHGIPLIWKSLITEWKPNERFVDVQLKGPYAKWHHTHSFEDIEGGTLIRDRVLYRLPLGWLGRLAGTRLVKSDLKQIFSYRRTRTADLLYEQAQMVN